MATKLPHSAVTNRAGDDIAGMTLRELVTFMGDALRAPIPVDQDAPLVVDTDRAGHVRTISAPLVPCTCPQWPGARVPLHHPACPHRIPSEVPAP